MSALPRHLFAVPIVALSLSGIAFAASMSLPEYRTEMRNILTALESGDLSSAQRDARSLQGSTIVSDGESFKADASILKPIASALLG